MSIRINGIDVQSTVNQKSDMPIGAYHLGANPNIYEPARSNTFEFVVTDIDGIVRAGMTGNEAQGTFPNAQEVLRLSVASASIPHYSQEPITIRRGNTVIKAAGTMSFDSGTVVFNDYIGAEAKSILMAWQNLSGNIYTEKVGLMSDYKKDCYLIEYTPDWQKIRQWILHGCWISSISEDNFDQDGNGNRRINVTIQYDRGEIDTSELA